MGKRGKLANRQPEKHDDATKQIKPKSREIPRFRLPCLDRARKKPYNPRSFYEAIVFNLNLLVIQF